MVLRWSDLLDQPWICNSYRRGKWGRRSCHECAKKHQLRIISAEDIGEKAPWDEDLTGNVLLVVGAEREGVSKATIEASDVIVKLPMDGFVPSYNLQVAVSVLAVESLRQRLK
jgi:tRNA G18 (ribose-2'-O)-methylase SpoU